MNNINKPIDEYVVSLFLMANNLHQDENIIYAKGFKEYIEAYDEYHTYYKVVTIDERTGSITTYRQYDNKYMVKWTRREW